MKRLGLIAGGLMMAALVPASAQQQAPDPFTLPPPTQQPQNPGQPGQRTPPVLTMEALARQGFEVRAIERATERANGFVVLLQRAGEVRTCLMRIDRSQGQMPRQTSICF